MTQKSRFLTKCLGLLLAKATAVFGSETGGRQPVVTTLTPDAIKVEGTGNTFIVQGSDLDDVAYYELEVEDDTINLPLLNHFAPIPPAHVVVPPVVIFDPYA